MFCHIYDKVVFGFSYLKLFSVTVRNRSTSGRQKANAVAWTQTMVSDDIVRKRESVD